MKNFNIADVVYINGESRALVEKDWGDKVDVFLQEGCCFDPKCKSCYGGHLTYDKCFITLLPTN